MSKYCYSFELSSLNKDTILRLLPTNFSISDDEKYLIYDDGHDTYTSNDENLINPIIQKECDRLFFLSGIDMNPSLKEIISTKGNSKAMDSRAITLYACAQIPENISRQIWTYELSLQLKLWALAGKPEVPIFLKINLLFQIIDIQQAITKDATHYPPYNDNSKDPDPNTEAKILRHLVSHGYEKMTNKQVRRYCEKHGISDSSNDLLDAKFMKLLNKRIDIVRMAAYNTIRSNISEC